MRHYPEDESDLKGSKDLKIEPWMLELLKLNPSYVSWGPYEDYMWNEKESWASRQIKESWKDFGPWDLDDLNEVVNFYFYINRENKECPLCLGDGYHTDAKWVTDSFYNHSSPFTYESRNEKQTKELLKQFKISPTNEFHQRGSFPTKKVLKKYSPEFHDFCKEMITHKCWHDRITQDEADALREHKRLHDLTHEWIPEKGWKEKNPPYIPTAEEINEIERSKKGFGHDAINRWILIEARLKRYGIPIHCPECKGGGYVYIEPKGYAGLVLWILHPRKGCSRGVDIKNIKQEELPEIFAYLRQAAERNAERFSKIPKE